MLLTRSFDSIREDVHLDMESIIRNVRDIEADKRQWLEAALQSHLQDNQRVLIMVLSPGVQADEVIRQKAVDHLLAISKKGSAIREQQRISVEKADQIVDEAIEHVRQKNPQ
jgi:hypothetical protein